MRKPDKINQWEKEKQKDEYEGKDCPQGGTGDKRW